MHGNGDLSLKLSSQSKQREENGVARSAANGVVKVSDLVVSKKIRHSQAEVDALEGRRVNSKALLKSRGTSTQGFQEDSPGHRSIAHKEQVGADDSASDGERSPLWTRPAHMRNGGIARLAQDSGVQPVGSRSNSEQGVGLKLPDENQASIGSPVARITLIGDSKLDQSLVKVTGGGLLKICVSKDCELQHHFEIESCSGGKAFETPIIVPGTVYVWRPPSPGKYHLTSVVYPWIKSIVTVLPATPSSEQSPSTPSEASESQPSTPDGPLSAAGPCTVKAPPTKLRAEDELHSALGARVSAIEAIGGAKREATTAHDVTKRKGQKANGVAAVGEKLEIVTQEVEVDGGPGSFGLVARTYFPAESSGKGTASEKEEEAASFGNEVDDLLRVPLLAKKSNARNRGDHAKQKQVDGNAWNASWGDSSADEGGEGEAPECGLRRRAKEGTGQVGADEESGGADAGLQMRQIINPGEIDEWVERISREEEESRNVRAEQSAPEELLEVTEAGAGPSLESEELEGAEAKKAGKAGKKKKRKSGKKDSAKLAPSADGAAAEDAPEEDDAGALLDDPMVGINRVLSSIPSTTGITHYDVSGAGMAKGGRPAKLMAIGRSPDGKMEVSPISPMMSPSSLMKGGLSNSKFATERAPPVDDDSNPYHRIGEFIDLESGLGYMDEPRLREIKNLAGGPRLPLHMGGFNGQGWPLGAPPHMAALVPELSCRSKSCPRKFVSSVSMLRHYLQRHYLQRHKKQGGDLLAERPAMMAFWADLTKEEQKELLNIKDVYMQSISGERVSAELVQKARFRKLHGIKGAKYMVLGEKLLNMVFSPLELPPTSSIDLFNALDEASEQTFLRGRTDPPVQRFVTADPARGMGDEGYLVGLLAFMLEDRIVSAWMKSKEEGARRTQLALMAEEEAAHKKRQKAQQKKDRKKQKKAAEHLKAEPAADTAAGPASDGASEAPQEDEASGHPQRSDSEDPENIDEPVFAAAVGPSVESQDLQQVGDAEQDWRSEPSLVQDGDAKALLASGRSGASESFSDGASGDGQADGGPDTASASSEAQSPSSSSETGPPPKAGSTESQARADAGLSTRAGLESRGSAHAPPSVQPERASADVSTSSPPAGTGAKLPSQGSGGSRAEEKNASPKGMIAVPVSRMGGKGKTGEVPKVSGVARRIPGETLVLVTKMGPRAREGVGRGKIEPAKQGGLNTSGERASGANAASGELSKGGSGEQSGGASEGVQTRAVVSEQGRQDGEQVPDCRIDGQRTHGREEATEVRADEAPGRGSFEVGPSEEVRVEISAVVGDGELPAVAAESLSEGPRAEALGACEGRGLSAVETALAEQAPTKDCAHGEGAEPEYGHTPASSSGAEKGAREAGESDDLQRKHSGSSDGKDGAKEGRRGRKSKGKKRGAAQPPASVGGDFGEAKGADEGEWTKKATQELKSLLMGTEAGAPSDGKGEAEETAPAPIDMGAPSQAGIPLTAQTSAPVASQLSVPFAKPDAETAGKEVETSPGPTGAESPEALGGAQKSGGWAGIVAAAAQKEAEERAALEGERKRKQQAEREQRTEKEQPAEAWPELGPVAKRAAPARKKKQGRRGETEAAAGPRGAVENGDEAMTAALVQSANGAGVPSNVELGVDDARGVQQSEGEVRAAGSYRAEKSGTAKEATWEAARDTGTWADGQGGAGNKRKGREGMGPEEIMAFFAARWHAAVNDPEAIRLGPPNSSKASEEVIKDALPEAPSPAVEGPTGWGLPSEASRVQNDDDQTRTARVSAPERSNQGGQARSGTGKSREEQAMDDGGWQEARTRKWGEGRGRRREYRQNAAEGVHRIAIEGRQRRSEAK